MESTDEGLSSSNPHFEKSDPKYLRDENDDLGKTLGKLHSKLRKMGLEKEVGSIPEKCTTADLIGLKKEGKLLRHEIQRAADCVKKAKASMEKGDSTVKRVPSLVLPSEPSDPGLSLSTSSRPTSGRRGSVMDGAPQDGDTVEILQAKLKRYAQKIRQLKQMIPSTPTIEEGSAVGTPASRSRRSSLRSGNDSEHSGGESGVGGLDATQFYEAKLAEKSDAVRAAEAEASRLAAYVKVIERKNAKLTEKARRLMKLAKGAKEKKRSSASHVRSDSERSPRPQLPCFRARTLLELVECLEDERLRGKNTGVQLDGEASKFIPAELHAERETRKALEVKIAKIERMPARATSLLTDLQTAAMNAPGEQMRLQRATVRAALGDTAVSVLACSDEVRCGEYLASMRDRDAMAELSRQRAARKAAIDAKRIQRAQAKAARDRVVKESVGDSSAPSRPPVEWNEKSATIDVARIIRADEISHALHHKEASSELDRQRELRRLRVELFKRDKLLARIDKEKKEITSQPAPPSKEESPEMCSCKTCSNAAAATKSLLARNAMLTDELEQTTSALRQLRADVALSEAERSEVTRAADAELALLRGRVANQEAELRQAWALARAAGRQESDELCTKNEEIARLEKTLAERDGLLAEMQNDLAALGEAAKDREDELRRMEEDGRARDALIVAKNARVKELEVKIEKQEGERNKDGIAHEEEVRRLMKKVTKRDRALQEWEREFEILRARKEALDADVLSAQKDAKEYANACSRLTQELEEVREDISEYKNAYETLNAEVTGLREGLWKAERSTKQTEDHLAKTEALAEAERAQAASRIARLQADLEQSEKRRKEVKAKLKEIQEEQKGIEEASPPEVESRTTQTLVEIPGLTWEAKAGLASRVAEIQGVRGYTFIDVPGELMPALATAVVAAVEGVLDGRASAPAMADVALAAIAAEVLGKKVRGIETSTQTVAAAGEAVATQTTATAPLMIPPRVATLPTPDTSEIPYLRRGSVQLPPTSGGLTPPPSVVKFRRGSRSVDTPSNRLRGHLSTGGYRGEFEEENRPWMDEINKEFAAQVPSETLGQYKEFFIRMDTNHSNDLDIIELSKLMEALGKPKTFLQLKNMIKSVSKTKTVDYRGFLTLMTRSGISPTYSFEVGGKSRSDRERAMEKVARDFVHAIAPARLSKLTSIFVKYDVDQSDDIDIIELGKMMEDLGHACNMLSLKRMIDSVDKTGSGTLCFREFLALMSKYDQETGVKTSAPSVRTRQDDRFDAVHREYAGTFTQEQLEGFKASFLAIDLDGSDDIDIGEFSLLLESIGIRKSFKELTEIVAQVDTDANGTVSYREFLEMMARGGLGSLTSLDTSGGGSSTLGVTPTGSSDDVSDV